MSLMAGDISTNPGPRTITYPCGMCKTSVKDNDDAICCDTRDTWHHIRQKCLGIKLDDYQSYQLDTNLEWSCDSCKNKNQNAEREMRYEFQKIKDDLNIPGVKIDHLNVNGLLSKMAEVKIFLQETNLDILAVPETKISPDIVNQLKSKAILWSGRIETIMMEAS